MTLALGARLGAYEVLDLIGVGGMGEVYRARDTRLDRTVAIKILPAELSADPDRRARFEREARTISTLNHPHICALYDIGEQDGQAYLVMEHLAGETLAERLDRARGALAFGDALRIGIDIAEALDHAHKHAIVHRDLKPGNVMLTQAGAKLLDFGLAKLQASQAITLVPDSSVVTRSHHLTVAGTIVGTVPYMAPEQIEGREADARTDVWAFGCVLYEMLTGQRAFKGETPGSLVGAILSKEPAPLTSLQPLVPPSLERLVARCLAKEPDERWDSTHDIASELRWLAQDARAGSGVGARGGIPGGRSARRRLAWVALGLAIGAGVTAGLFQLTERQNAGSRGVVRFSIEVPPSRELGPIAFSPTGDRLAYVGTENGLRQIWVRRFDRSEDEALRGTAGADSPFFSPDGKWIGFFADDRLKKILADGGEVVTICSAKIESGGVIGGTATWIRDDTIVFSRGMTGLSRVLATGGTATPLTTLDAAKGELGHSWPEVLPEGQGTLYTVVTGGALDQYHVAALSPSAGRREGSQVVGVASRYVGNGHVVYAQQGQLLALRYDATRLEPVSTPVVVVDNVGFRDRAGTGSVIHVQPLYAVSRMGDLAYASASPPPTGVLVRLDRAGGKKAVAELPRGVRGALSLSPDGRRLALYHGQAGGFTLWMVDVERGVSTRVLAEGNPHAPVWSPDGERLAVSLDRGGTSNLSSLAADGTGKRVLL